MMDAESLLEFYRIHPNWRNFFRREFTQDYFWVLWQKVEAAYGAKTVFPEKQQLLRAFQFDPKKISVVILGQDPYYTPGLATGLAFAVPAGVKWPPSLKNIYREVVAEMRPGKVTGDLAERGLGKGSEFASDLVFWADQGVFLLNTVLSVEAGQANSHTRWGWEQLTERALLELNKTRRPLVFLLWGRQAAEYREKLGETKAPRLFLISAHPSPLSAYRGFFGNGHFLKTNEFLRRYGLASIRWL